MHGMKDVVKKGIIGGACGAFVLSWVGLAGGCVYHAHRADVAEEKLAAIAQALEEARAALAPLAALTQTEKPKPAPRWTNVRAVAAPFRHEMEQALELAETSMYRTFVDKELEEENMCLIPKGTRVLLLEVEGPFARIRLEDSTELYTFTACLDDKEVVRENPKKWVKFKRPRVAFLTRKGMREHHRDACEDVPEYVSHWVIPAEQQVWMEDKTEGWYRVSDDAGRLWYVPR